MTKSFQFDVIPLINIVETLSKTDKLEKCSLEQLHRGICMHVTKRHAARGKAIRLIGGLGTCSPEKKKWCVLKNISLKFCAKKICKNIFFIYKNNR